MPESGRQSEAAGARVFATTHWSVVLAARDGDSVPARQALETLCGAYWYPICAYVRRKGYGPDDAQDLTQELLAQLVRKEHLRWWTTKKASSALFTWRRWTISWRGSD